MAEIKWKVKSVEDLWNYKAKALEGSPICILKLPKIMTGIVLERQ